MIVIIADDERHAIGGLLHNALQARGAETDYIPLKDVNIKPCTGCNGCAYKSYGKCVIRDDADLILHKIIHADTVLLVSPVAFGSYSFKVKRVLDKLGLIMDRHYHVKNKQIVKGSLMGRFHLVAVGVTSADNHAGAEAFQRLVQENIFITQGTGRAFIAGAELSPEVMAEIIREVTGA
jgi:multimeric flavodoxin WrbA